MIWRIYRPPAPIVVAIYRKANLWHPWHHSLVECYYTDFKAEDRNRVGAHEHPAASCLRDT
jgi:hypothetical protein